MGKLTVDEASVLASVGQARESNTSADLNEISVALAKIELVAEERKAAYEATADHLHGVLYYTGEIDEGGANELGSALRRLSRLRPGEEITIYLNSPGGSLNSGFQMIDDIAECSVPVNIIVRSQACSMAAVVLQGATGYRAIGRHAELMLHRASFGVEGNAAEVEDVTEYIRGLEARVYRFLSSRTKLSAPQWKAKMSKRKDIFFDAEEALKLGLVDRIG